jgi:hypothetical protein
MKYLLPIVMLAVAVAAAEKTPEKAPRMRDGHPDLSGNWTYATLTTLERPKEFGNKAFLTAAEAADLEKTILTVQNRDRRDGDGPDGRGPDGRTDLDRAYGQAWWEFGSKLVGTRRTSLIVDPPDGQIPPLTADGERRALDKRGLWTANGEYEGGARGASFDSYADRPLQERCMGWTVTGPPMIPGAYNNNLALYQNTDHVVVMNEMVHEHRIIPLDGRPQVAAPIRMWMGSSRGHWQGDTLVVESSNFRPMVFRSASGKLKLTERFTRVDRETLVYEFTVEDPLTWVKPWTAQFPMTRIDEPVFEYACHEGNYSLPNILAGARKVDP